MLRNSRNVLLMLLALLVTTISLGGCAFDPKYAGAAKRTLPPEDSVVLRPVVAPIIGPGDDARIAWKKEEAARIENGERLVKSRMIYRGVRKKYAKGK